MAWIVELVILTAKLAVGYLLDELKNDITRETPASFEPSIDCVVTKIPRFAFEKFPQANPTNSSTLKIMCGTDLRLLLQAIKPSGGGSHGVGIRHPHVLSVTSNTSSRQGGPTPRTQVG